MPALVSSFTAQAVIDNIISTLRDTQVDGQTLFRSVEEFDDIESFQRIGDPMKAPAVGVIASPVDRSRSSDNSSTYVERLSLEIAFTAQVKRPPGSSERVAMAAVNDIIGGIKAALRADPSRGGNCELVVFNEQMIAGTEITGAPRLISNGPNQSFYIAAVPVVCGWQSE
jgi:hypothetical protein